MAYAKRIAFLAILLLVACQPGASAHVQIIENGQVRVASMGNGIPAAILAEAGVALDAADKILVNGIPHPADEPIDSNGLVTLQVRRAVPVTLIAPNRQITLNTAAATVGEVIQEAGLGLSDRKSVV